MIAEIDNYTIHMYSAPSEHGHPHIHIVDKITHNTFAKYRIDRFERMQGPPNLDATIRNWISTNRASLLISWQNCMNCMHPIKIAW
jgi:hypothetical protein